MANGSKVLLRIIFKGTPFIPPARPGKGKSIQPRKGSIAADIAPGELYQVQAHRGGHVVWCAGEELV